MRITSGTFRNRKLDAPEGHDVRPTSDKMRQVIFNMLMKYALPADAVVLDVFCGTGALGLEALSRGAAFCTFIDQSRESLSFCRRNAETLKVTDQSDLLHRDATKPGPRTDKNDAASLIFLDPPYNKNLVTPTLTALAENNWLAEDALCIVETEKNANTPAIENFILLDERIHGATKIFFYRYK